MLPQSRDLRRRPETRAVLIHTTGRVFARRVAQDAGTDDPLRLGAAAVERYARLRLPYYAHVLVDPVGDARQLADPGAECHHAAPLDGRYRGDWRPWAYVDGRWRLHGRDPAVVWDWWDARWPGYATPLALPPGGRPNATTVAIDVLPLPEGDDWYTPEQLATVADIAREVCEEAGLPFNRRHVLAHEDLDPCRRGVVLRDGVICGIPWDPGTRFDWSALDLEPVCAGVPEEEEVPA